MAAPDRDQTLLQAALEHPFEPTDVPLSSTTSSPPPSTPADPPSEPHPTPNDDDTWQTAYAAQVSEWRAQSAAARSKAELARAKWEALRAEAREPPEPCPGLGDHITASVAAADEVVSASMTSLSADEHLAPPQQESLVCAAQEKTDGSPLQPWEHISSSPTSSYPSMSFPEASVPHSPSHQHASLAPTSASAPAHTRSLPRANQHSSQVPHSTLPSIMDSRVARRTRLSLVLSSLAINLLLPFINGVMLGFGEIFAKEVVVGWFGWKSRYGTAGVGLRQ